MIRIEVGDDMERRILISLMFARMLRDGRTRHGLTKRTRDARRAWRKRQLTAR